MTFTDFKDVNQKPFNHDKIKDKIKRKTRQQNFMVLPGDSTTSMSSQNLL